MVHEEISMKKAIFLDLDGVIWKGRKMIEGANKAISELQKAMKVIFITNNSTKTRAQYVDRMKRLDISVTKEEIMTSGYAAAIYFAETAPESRIYLIGEEGLKSELENHGHVVVNENNTTDIDFVLVGLDRFFNYEKMAQAMTAIINGAKFFATNDDAQLPTEQGLFPGSGSLVSALITCSGKEVEKIFGKPNTYMLEISLNKLGINTHDASMVGDRLETDILAANRLKIYSILVLSGVTSLNNLKVNEISPDLILDSINDLVR